MASDVEGVGPTEPGDVSPSLNTRATSMEALPHVDVDTRTRQEQAAGEKL